MIDSTNCGFQLCSHPQCWYSNRLTEQRMNEINYLAKSGFTPKCLPKPRKSKLFPPLKSGRPTTDVTDYLPSINVVNVSSDSFLPSSVRLVDDTAKKSPPFHNTSATTSKLSLSSSNETPANSLRSFKSYRPLTMNGVESSLSSWKSRCSRINLSLGELVEKTQKKSLVWKPSKRKVKKSAVGNEAASCTVKWHELPIDQVPEYKSRASNSRRNIRGRKVYDAIKHTQDSSQTNKGTAQPLCFSPPEIQDLLQIPTDELFRILKGAVEQKIVSVKQAKTLLNRVQEERYNMAMTGYPEDDMAVGGSKLSQANNHQQVFACETDNKFPARKKTAYLLKRSLPSTVYKLDAATRSMAEEMIKPPANNQVPIPTSSSTLIQLQPAVSKLSTSPPQKTSNVTMATSTEAVKTTKKEGDGDLTDDVTNTQFLSQVISQITLTDESLGKDQYFSELDFSADEPTTGRESISVGSLEKKRMKLLEERRTCSAREVRCPLVVLANKPSKNKVLVRASSAMMPRMMSLLGDEESPDPPPPSPDRFKEAEVI